MGALGDPIRRETRSEEVFKVSEAEKHLRALRARTNQASQVSVVRLSA